MPQDTFTLRLVARELNLALRGGRVNKIIQPEKEELSLIIYTGRETLKLTINANASQCGIYFTSDNPENPLVAPNFCMLLRKYLQSAEILSVEMPVFERIVCIRFLCNSDFSSKERILRCEIMGKYSNIILTENDIILGALKTTSMDVNLKRHILPGVKYVYPAAQEKVSPEHAEELSSLFSPPPEGELSAFLFSHVAGLAPITAKMIVESFHGGNFAKHVHDFIFSDEISPCVVEQGGIPVDFCARAVKGAIPFETLSEAQSYYYQKKRAKRTLEGKRRTLLQAILAAKKKQEKNLAQYLSKRQECASFEENRIKGELLNANLYRLQRGMKSCTLPNFYDEEGGTMQISLDENLYPAQNAQNYFKKYRKQKRTLEALAPREKETQEEIYYLSSLQASAETAEEIDDLNSLEEEMRGAGLLKEQEKRIKKSVEIPFRAYEKDGFKIFAGRNNLQNDKLVRGSDGEDVWLHTQKFHSCHVVIKTQKREVSEEVLLFAAEICVRFSDAKGGGKVPVDYCKVKFVKKPSHAKAGFVVYTDYKTLLVDPLP